MTLNLWTVCFLCLSVLAAHAATHYLVPTNTSAAMGAYELFIPDGTMFRGR